MIFWLVSIMTLSAITSLVITIEGLSFMLKSGNIQLGLPVFLLGMIVSVEASAGFSENGAISPLFWGFETLLLSVIFIWIIILLGGKKNE